MAGLIALSELEAKKRALVAESEAYRQTLVLHVHHLKLAAVRFQSRLNLFRKLEPALALLPLVSSFFGSRAQAGEPKARPAGWRRLLRWGLLGWRLSRQYGPVARVLLARFRHGRRHSRPGAEAELSGD